MEDKPQKPRRTFLIFLLIAVPILFLIGWSQASLNLKFIRPQTAEETYLLLALSTIVFLAFVIFALILTRILLKLYVERRQNLLGSRFKTKMVAAFLTLSLVPVFFLYIFAYGLLNHSIDRWFGIPFDVLRGDANEMVQQLELQTSQQALDSSNHLAVNPRLVRYLSSGNTPGIRRYLLGRVHMMGLESVACFDRAGRLVLRVGGVRPDLKEIRRLFPEIAARQVPEEGASERWRSPDSSLFLAAQPVENASGAVTGSIVVVRSLPLNIQEIAQQIQREAQRYDELSRERKALKRTYMLILLLITLVILFAATWLAMFFSKQVTVPIQALAEATHEVSRGNMDWRVTARADAELGSLIRLFNEMTSQLQESRQAIERAAGDLQRANRQLEERSNTMEAILENVPTGVISFNPQQEITRINSTAQRMFGSKEVKAARRLEDVFSTEDAREVARLFRRAERQGVVTRQMQLAFGDKRSIIGLTLSSVRAQHGAVGYVMVLEDLTEVMMAQRSAAWREVAQRIAHEIKNPLTPIQLSSERIARLIGRSSQTTPPANIFATISESASLIGREVSTLKSLVDEFSRFARFPASRPIPSDLNAIVENALRVFDGRLSGIHIHVNLAPDLAMVSADPEQMKRVIVNLIDNAAEALEQSPAKDIWLRTSPDPDQEMVGLIVADSGPGISPEAKERLFLPFFSTKQRGTGLGLAIVSRIISDHNGTIRAEENYPAGTKFIISLPAESAVAVKVED
jgi:two-component system, NtrC family, nitrogen regulation sensor histidine kinase NtrY